MEATVRKYCLIAVTLSDYHMEVLGLSLCRKRTGRAWWQMRCIPEVRQTVVWWYSLRVHSFPTPSQVPRFVRTHRIVIVTVYYKERIHNKICSKKETHRTVWETSKIASVVLTTKYCKPGILLPPSGPKVLLGLHEFGMAGWLPMWLNSVSSFTEALWPSAATLKRWSFWCGLPTTYVYQVPQAPALSRNTPVVEDIDYFQELRAKS